MLAILLLTFGFATRFFIHTPNFTPVIALALFGGVYLNRKYALLLPLCLMAISDIVIGMHNVVFFTWGSIVAISLLGTWLKSRNNWVNIASTNLLGAILFFVVTNFGVWAMGWYPPTLAGLADCFWLAIPFFRTTLLSTAIYSVILFGLYELAAYRVKDTRLARVLLTS